MECVVFRKGTIRYTAESMNDVVSSCKKNVLLNLNYLQIRSYMGTWMHWRKHWEKKNTLKKYHWHQSVWQSSLKSLFGGKVKITTRLYPQENQWRFWTGLPQAVTLFYDCKQAFRIQPTNQKFCLIWTFSACMDEKCATFKKISEMVQLWFVCVRVRACGVSLFQINHIFGFA